MRIAMANDHAGTALKNEIADWLRSEGHEVVDFGAHDEEACDLPDHVYPAALAVASGDCERGIFVDGVGYGSAMIANKVPGVRAALGASVDLARLAREHNDANVVALGGRMQPLEEGYAIVRAFLDTPFSQGERHVRRIAMINTYESRRG